MVRLIPRDTKFFVMFEEVSSNLTEAALLLRHMLSHHDEIPIEGVVGQVAKASSGLAMPGEHEHREHDGVADVGEEVQRVQPEQEPDRRTVGVIVPSKVKRIEFVKPQNDRRNIKYKRDRQQDFHRLFASARDEIRPRFGMGPPA